MEQFMRDDLPVMRRLAPPQLVGTWLLERQIHDFHHNRHGYASGIAEMNLAPDGSVAWLEYGDLKYDERVTQFRRLLELRQDSDDEWGVWFENGTWFHDWSATDFVHTCSPDRYAGRVRISSESSWTLTWQVSGPSKEYTLTTTYKRVS